MRPFEQQTALERTLRAHLWHPKDLLERSQKNLPLHVRRKEYREAAQCQSSIIEAKVEIQKWENLLDLYEAELRGYPVSIGACEGGKPSA